MTKVKIKSDGTGPGTRIWVDGKEYKNVGEIKWNLKASGFAEVTLKLADVELDVDGQCAMKFEGTPPCIELDGRATPGVHEIIPCGNCGVVECAGCVTGEMKR